MDAHAVVAEPVVYNPHHSYKTSDYDYDPREDLPPKRGKPEQLWHGDTKEKKSDADKPTHY